MDLSSLGGGALPGGGSFYYHGELLPSSALAPPLGPERGGTRVAIAGGAFADACTLRCRFGAASSAVLARQVDEGELECASPLHSAGARGVGVSMNGQQYAGPPPVGGPAAPVTGQVSA